MSIAIISIILCIISVRKREKTIDHLINSVIAMQEGKGEVNLVLIEEAVSRMQKKEILSEKENFLIGYKAYAEGDIDEADVHLNQVICGSMDKLKIYSAKMLIEAFMLQENEKEVTEIVYNLLINIKHKTYNEEMDLLTEIMRQVISIEDGRMKIIKVLENVLHTEKGLNEETVCDLKNKLAILYLNNGNYARGIEKCLEVIAQSEEMENKYYGAKAYIDLGVVYGTLGHMKEARSNIEKGMNIHLEDIEEEAFIKTYAAVNLYENILCEQSYDEIQQVHGLVMRYADYLSEEAYDSIVLINDIFLGKYKQQIGELAEAEAILGEIEKKLEQVQEYTYSNVYTNYILAKAELMLAKGEIQQSIHYYETALKLQDAQFQKFILKTLSDVLNAHHQYEEANVYEEQLREWYEKEAKMVNIDYSSYALYKYEHECQLIKEADEKIKKYVQIMIVSVLMMIGVLNFALKYIRLSKLNKLDGLTKIYNRSYFEIYYEGVIKQERDFGIIIFDIDNFKMINDTYGHLAGDKVIRKVVEISKKVLAKQGEIFRYGGEEFVVILPNYGEAELIGLAEELRQAIASYEWQYGEIVTVSLGIAETKGKMRDIFQFADQNLYVAKAEGKNKAIYKI